MALKSFMERFAPLVRTELESCLTEVQPESLRLAMGHLLGRGKLLRPLIVLAACEASGGDAGARVQCAAPFELVHTFTLIHDDLPCMDDADMRRGVQSVHLLSGEAVAVLAGDALLNLAFSRLADECSGLDADTRLRLVSVAARATHLVVEGQVLDLEGEGRRLTMDELRVLHSKKTGALLGACFEAGGVIAGAGDAQLSALWDAGVQLGLVFQIRDDLLSVVGDESVVGKSLGADEDQDKSTYPRLLGVTASEELLEEGLTTCKAMINGIGLADPSLLLELAEVAAHRDH